MLEQCTLSLIILNAGEYTQAKNMKTPPQKLGWKRLIANVMLLFLSLGVSLGVAEFCARRLKLALPYYPMARTAITLYHDDPNGLIQLTPGWQGYVGGVWTTINEKGFRDRVFPSTPPPDTIRVAILGDSYTMGDGVPLHLTYPKQLERLLLSKESSYEVMNCGISATNSLNQVEVLRNVLRDYHPNVVILGYNINDFDYPTQTRFDSLDASDLDYTIHPDKRVTLNSHNVSGWQRLKLAIRYRLYLYRYLARLRDRWQQRKEMNRDPVQTWIRTGAHQKSFEAVKQMNMLCAASDASFLVVLLPDLLRVSLKIHDLRDYPYAEVHDMITAYMKTHRIECLDLLPFFAGHEPYKLVVHPLDHHYNQKGNALVAQALLTYFNDPDNLFLIPSTEK